MISRLARRLFSPAYQARTRTMSSGNNGKPIYFGSFEVTDQVFYTTPLSFALVNLKPLLPGHVLVCPHRHVLRLTDLTPPEISDLFVTVQRIQRMLAVAIFPAPGSPLDGSFNIAIQDGPEAGQSVAHVHCHIIPRVRDDGKGDGIYGELAGEKGNVGGHLWDRQRGMESEERPKPGGGRFPKIEDADRKPRSMDEMRIEAASLREKMRELDESEAST